MDLASAVQFLIGYEASLKLAPGQKPPPPSPSLLIHLTHAVAAIERERVSKPQNMQFLDLPPSVWSDWPLCCGFDLSPAGLKAARSLPPSFLRERGLLSLFLALHSCAEAKVGPAVSLSYWVLMAVAWHLKASPKIDDPTPFPSAHLAARVGHRLINADDTLDFQVQFHGTRAFDMWHMCMLVIDKILFQAKTKPSRATPAVPHEAAGLSLAKETAAMLEALCAAQRGSEAGAAVLGRGLSNRLPFLMVCQLLFGLDVVLERTKETFLRRSFWRDIYREAAALPAYDPAILIQSFYRNIDSGLGRGSMGNAEWSEYLGMCRSILWTPLCHRGPISRLRPADAYTVLRLGLEDMGRQKPCGDDRWYTPFTRFTTQALHSGLVRPELILRARPQLLEGLVEGLARGRIRGAIAPKTAALLVALLNRFPAISFHLRKFFSRSGCLQACVAVSDPSDKRKELIRLLGPRAAQSGTKLQWDMRGLLEAIAGSRDSIRDTAQDIDHSIPAFVCEFILHDLTLDHLRDPRFEQPILQYLSELVEEITAPKRPQDRYGVLMVVGLGKACLALSNLVSSALTEIGESGLKLKGVRGAGGARANQRAWRALFVQMGKEVSLLRRRVLRELLPLAEAREAALWEGVREEEVVAALQGTQGRG